MDKDYILVIGGAGYIGSVCVKMLCDLQYNVVVIDNLSKGKISLVDSRANFYKLDIISHEDKILINKIFINYNFTTIIHFAAFKDADESMRDIVKYSDNIISIINILNYMVRYNIKKIIYSSSAAVYGDVNSNILIDETHETNPINFYGFTKLEGENILNWYSKLNNINFVSLRYFNVVGDGNLNYIDPEANNLFPIIAEVITGKRDKLKIFGSTYNTKDGTPIRDYIHVLDLVDAHIKALDLKSNHIINLSSSKGYSVMEILKEFENCLSIKIPFEIVDKREGDPAYLVASSEKAEKLLNWKTKYNLTDMVQSTINAYLN